MNRDIFINLRSALVSLYPEEASIRRITADAGIETWRIALHSNTLNQWDAVLSEAEKLDRVVALLGVVEKEYGTNQKFSNACTAYRQATKETLTLQSDEQNSTSDCQTHEHQGDILVQRAKRADLREDRAKLWQEAEQAYEGALLVLPKANQVVQQIRLYRKIASTLRSQGEIERAQNETLAKAKQALRIANEQALTSTELRLEEAYYQLECAYCHATSQDWEQAQFNVEALIDQFDQQRTLDLHADFYYVVGCAYNLLAIAIEKTNKPGMGNHRSSKHCWDTARSYLRRIKNDKKAEEALRDIEINEAPRLNEQGYCDKAIFILEDILRTEKQDPSLQTSRRIIVQQTLAAGYLYRLASDDLEKAQELAFENLTWAKRQEEITEWVNALQLALKVLLAKIEATKSANGSSDGSSVLLEQAEEEYHNFHRSGKLGTAWQTDPDELELRRLLAEIYLVADQLPKATEQIDFIETYRSKDEDRDEGDIDLTLARFYCKRGELSEARVKLKDARLHFNRTGHLGMVVEADLLWGEVDASQNKWEEAQKRLQETLKIAEKLACATRIERVKGRMQQLGEISKNTPAALGLTTILFLASDPSDLARLRLGEEYRDIREQLQLAQLRERFHLENRLAVRTRDISLALLKEKPQIVHFAGHAARQGGIYLENKLGEAHLVPPDALAGLFQEFANQINCVILNACYTAEQATAIAQHIRYVIGISDLVDDQSAIDFSIGFYQALGAGRSYEEAFRLGRILMDMQEQSSGLQPVFIQSKQ